MSLKSPCFILLFIPVRGKAVTQFTTTQGPISLKFFNIKRQIHVFWTVHINRVKTKASEDVKCFFIGVLLTGLQVR